MVKDKNWKTDYLIENLLTKDCVRQLPHDELRSLFDKAGKDYDTFSKKRYGPLEKKYVKKVFEPAHSKAEYHEKHAEEKDHVTNNLVLTRGEMESKKLYGGKKG